MTTIITIIEGNNNKCKIVCELVDYDCFRQALSHLFEFSYLAKMNY